MTSDEAALQKLKEKVDSLKEGTMERMLLEMQLDTKIENIKMRKLLCNMMKKNTQLVKEVSALADKDKLLDSKVQNLSTQVESATDESATTSKKMENIQKDMNVLVGIVQKQAMMIEHLQHKNEIAENKKIKNDIIIQGIEYDENDTEQHMKELVTDFFKHTMKIRKNVAIRSIEKLGKRKPPAVKVTLQHIKDKGVIFKCIKNIIDAKNNQDDPYYVNDNLTLEGQEIQRRNRYIKKKIADIPVTDQPKITFNKGKLHINNEEYKKKIGVPSVTDIMDKENDEKIHKLYQTDGELMINGACKFQAISQEVRTYDDVRCGYIKACHKHPDALHVVCAFNLPGHDIHLQDFADAGELGAGRNLLELLTDNDITHRAIYVVRYYDGKQLGPSRFLSYEEATISAISRSSYNSLTKRNQFPLKSAKPKKDTSDKHQIAITVAAGYARATSPRPFSSNSNNGTITPSPLASPIASDSVWTHGTKEWSEASPNKLSRNRADLFLSLANTIKDAAYRAKLSVNAT